MHHDLERSGENDRRRLESQIQMLENQTYVIVFVYIMWGSNKSACSQDMRSQLSQERDTARHSSLQKDLELRELRARIDKLVGFVDLTILCVYSPPLSERRPYQNSGGPHCSRDE